jgi:DNA-binding NtrC family response regulator
MALVLIDDRNVATAFAVRKAAEADGHATVMVPSADHVDPKLDGEETVALVITGDLASDRTAALLRSVDGLIPRPPVIAVVAPEELEDVRAAPGSAVYDEVIAGPPEPEEIQVALTQQVDRYELQLSTGIVGRTEGIREVLERIHMLAPVNSTVLITGESGTGKELAARGIHRLSPRRARPFIAVNCAAMPESLLESELFGHEKGAFTGATSRRRGLFELADAGTLFLDEIGEMPPSLQTRLLRVLETQRFMRVGGDVEIEVNVRVIAATNRNLRDAVQEGAFRRDLYYRLNVLHLDMPALRERKSDIAVLVRRFITEFSLEHDREFKGLDAEAMKILLDYEWPGNVRELRNLVESMVVLAPGAVIRAADIPPEIRSSSGRALLPMRSIGALPVGVEPGGAAAPAVRLPQMEFLFRTLVEMKIDLEDLRSEFERFRSRYTSAGTVPAPASPGTDRPAIELRGGEWLEERTRGPAPHDGAQEAGGAAIPMTAETTMSDVEREAIAIALRDVGGNRRKAAERLGIGERTLYRKIKEFGIES